MKKIINGKMYNTETAKEIGSWNNGRYRSDFYYVGETLYKKKTGELFVFGEGGAASRYAERCGGNSTCFGEDIIPLSQQDAKEWVERKLDADAYVELFGEVEEQWRIVK